MNVIQLAEIALKIPSCKCDRCMTMCSVPCLPTVEETDLLIKNGFGLNLMRYNAMAADIIMPAGLNKERVTTIHKGRSGCVFQDGDNMCILHDEGLKPLEARLAHHNYRHYFRPHQIDYLDLDEAFVEDWLTDAGVALVQHWTEVYGVPQEGYGCTSS